MAKSSHSKYGGTDDYLAQVEWQNQQSQRRVPLPWHMEPKWNYKKVGPANRSSDTMMVLVFLTIIGIACAALWYFLGTAALPVLIGLLFLGIFFVLMIRDAKPKNKR